MKEPLVTIIIPFYNDEEFLERAVRSAIDQTYANIEIVLVNDGSTDNSSKIAFDLKCESDNLVLIHSEHHSIGRARNIGIQKASGKYIVFLDSDDELENDAVQQMLSVIESQNADAVIGAFGMYNMNGQILHVSANNGLSTTLNNNEATIALCKEKIARVVWAKIFKTEIAQQVNFPEGILFEDGPYLMEYFYKCNNNIVVADILTTKHFCRPSSVTRKVFKQKRIDDTYAAFEIEWALIKTSNQEGQISKHLFAYYQRALMNCLVILTTDRKRVNNLNEVEKNVQNILKRFVKERVQNEIILGPRTKIDAGLIRLNEILGWAMFYRIFPLIKRNLFRKIATIRSF